MRRDVVAGVVVGSIKGACKGVYNSIVRVIVVVVPSHAVREACVMGEKGERGEKVAAGLAALLQTVTVTRQTMRGASSRSENVTVRDQITNRNTDTFVCNVKCSRLWRDHGSVGLFRVEGASNEHRQASTPER